MISETMPLNEWPVELLNSLEIDLSVAYWLEHDKKPVDATLYILSVVRAAIKDAQERENELPFK